MKTEKSFPVSKKFLPFVKNFNEISCVADRMPFIGREKEMGILMETLVRRMRNNVVVVGTPGVGKTSLVMELAARICRGETSRYLMGKTIVRVAVNALIAARRERGGMAEDIELLFQELSQQRDKLILFLDELDLPALAGGKEGDACLPCAVILKHHLAMKELTVIATATPDQYDRYIKPDEILSASFEALHLEEPKKSEMIRILEGVRPYFQRYYSLNIPGDILARIHQLALAYNPSRSFPDKAIEMLDTACAKASVHNLSELDMAQVYETAAAVSKLPVGIVRKDHRKLCLGLQKYLEKCQVNQKNAIKEVSRVIKTRRLDRDPGRLRPEIILLLLGPTGIGKSFMAAKIAQYFFGSRDKLRIINLSTFKKSDDIQRLVGSIPGEDRGTLIREVAAHPFSVILFENVGEAHSAVLAYLARIITAGTVTDNGGRKHRLSSIIFILSLTSIGEERHETSIGFEKKESGAREIIISPKIMNVLDWVDEIIQFAPLQAADLKQICLEELGRVLLELKNRYNCLLQVDIRVVDSIAREAEKSGRFAHFVTEKIERLIRMQALDLITGTRRRVHFQVRLNRNGTLDFRKVEKAKK